MRNPCEIFSGPIQPQLPYVDVPRAPFSAKFFALTIRLHRRVEIVRKNSLNLVISSRGFREVSHDPSLEIDPHHRRPPLGLIASESHLAIVIIKILRLQSATPILALINRLLMDQPRRAREINLSHD